MAATTATFESRVLDVWDAGRNANGIDRATLVFSLLDEPGVGWPDITLGERNRMMLRAHADLFGRARTGVVSCECGERFEIDLPGPEDLPETTDETATVEIDGECVAVSPATCRIVSDVAGAGGTAVDLARSCAPAATVEWSSERLERLEATLAALDPAAVIDLNVACPNCEEAMLVPLDPTSFVWTRVDAWAQLTLDDVHVLARSYGWTEEEVLTLTPARRHHYLERALR